MRKIFSLSIFAFLAVIVFAFYSTEEGGKNNPDSPSYEVAKHKFWDAYVAYKDNLSKGIITERPVDPSGNFKIDENGNFSMITGENNQDRIIEPNVSPDVVNNYTFAQSTSTYTAINGTGTLVGGSGNCDDAGFGPFSIGFNFTYNGVTQTQFGVGCNGYLQFGAVAPALGYAPLTTSTLIVAPGAYDMQLNSDGAIYYQTSGVAPNRILTIEWYHQGIWPTSGNELSYEIKLYETTNAVQLIYQTGSHTSTVNLEVGINGGSTADYLNRTTTTNWSNTTAGGTNAATCTFSPSVFPPSGLTFTWTPPAPPAVPTLIRPLNHSVGRPLVDTLQWSVSAGATNYHLQIALDSLMTSLVFSDTTLTGVQYTVGTFSPLTNWWWRVRAKNAVGWSNFCISQVFRTMGAATTPTLLTPVNNAINQPLTLTCVWSRATDQTSKPGGIHIITEGNPTEKIHSDPKPFTVSNYWYELYSDTTTTPLVRDSTLTDTTRQVTGLNTTTNYWWRVKAKNNVGWGVFSAYFHFTTVPQPPLPPTLISPANGSSSISITPKMDWSAVATATSYRIQISNDPNFATTQLDSVTNVDSLFVPAGRLLNNTQYFWHVYASNPGGNSAYSSIFSFTTAPVGITSNNGEIPKVFKLYEAYPNPFNPSTTIKFDIPKNAEVKMVVYNILGEAVGTLVNSHYDAGSYSVTWDAANFASGVYFYKITAGDYADIRRMVLIK